jgi:hypothetical protein
MPLFIETNFWNVDTAFGLIAGKSLTKEFLLYFCKSFNFKEFPARTRFKEITNWAKIGFCQSSLFMQRSLIFNFITLLQMLFATYSFSSLLNYLI